MDFGALPPEINSGRMYFGAGSGPLLSAAFAWNSLAAELRSAAASCQSVVSGLTIDRWLGSASMSMAAAAASHLGWMNTLAAQAEQTAVQAKAAATAFESAFAATVPPPVIAANRTQLATLVATNVLGQNAPAIAATEAHYGEMWAQDAATMYGYAGSSAAAAQLTPFTAPQPTTNPSALAGQAAAIAQATGTTQATLTQLTSAMPTALQDLASPAASTTSSTSGFWGLVNLLAGNDTSTTGAAGLFNALFSSNGLGLNSNFWNTIFSSGFYMPANYAVGDLLALLALGNDASATEAIDAAGQAANGGLAGGLGSALANPPTGLGGIGSAVSAGAGQAATIGPLSVPPTWTGITPPVPPLASTLGEAPLAAPPAGTQNTTPIVPPLAFGRGANPITLPDNRFLARPPMLPAWSVG